MKLKKNLRLTVKLRERLLQRVRAQTPFRHFARCVVCDSSDVARRRFKPREVVTALPCRFNERGHGGSFDLLHFRVFLRRRAGFRDWRRRLRRDDVLCGVLFHRRRIVGGFLVYRAVLALLLFSSLSLQLSCQRFRVLDEIGILPNRRTLGGFVSFSRGSVSVAAGISRRLCRRSVRRRLALALLSRLIDLVAPRYELRIER